jgi:hypothetical protein
MARRQPILLAILLTLVLPACQDDGVMTTPALSLSCSAQPSAGPAPLAVSFLLNVAGAEGAVTYSISYGDGATGSDPGAPHTYATSGSYTPSFEVRTATQSARCSASVSVSAGTPQSSGNQAPHAVFGVTPAPVGGIVTGKAPFTVSFDMCRTSDPEDDELYFLMDFEGDGSFDFKGITGFHCRADHSYAAGTYRPLNCVYDRDAERNPLHDDQCQVYTVVATP